VRSLFIICHATLRAVRPDACRSRQRYLDFTAKEQTVRWRCFWGMEGFEHLKARLDVVSHLVAVQRPQTTVVSSGVVRAEVRKSPTIRRDLLWSALLKTAIFGGA